MLHQDALCLLWVNAGPAVVGGTRSMGKPGSTGECHATLCEGFLLVPVNGKPWDV